MESTARLMTRAYRQNMELAGQEFLSGRWQSYNLGPLLKINDNVSLNFKAKILQNHCYFLLKK